MRLLVVIYIVGALVGLSYELRATTTRYCDRSPGACGFKSDYHGVRLTAGVNPGLFGEGTWCGKGCGKCYRLRSTDKSPPG